MSLHSEIWGETEKPGTMMGTHTVFRDDHPGTFLARIRFKIGEI